MSTKGRARQAGAAAAAKRGHPVPRGGGEGRDSGSSRHPLLAVYFAFAAAYFLSYFYRTANAVLSPQLTAEFGLSASQLGLLTSAYFVTFGLAQLPLGLLLDRHGPRRVEGTLLLFAAAGALLFALGQGFLSLLLARALIGLGVAACLMAALKGFVLWYPVAQRPALSGWIMVAGGSGALVSTAPLEVALQFTHWRVVFFALAGATLLVAMALWRTLPEEHGQARPQGGELVAGLRAVLSSARFWWIAPLGGLGMGGFMAVQGLWSMPWLMDVGGYGKEGAAQVLLGMSVAQLAGYLVLGLFAARLARWGIEPRGLFLGGFSLHLLSLALILWGGGRWSLALWCVYGLSVTINVLGFNLLAEGFPDHLAARSSTALNLMMFAGSFFTQWGIGVVIDLARGGFGASAAAGLRSGLLLLFALQLLSWLWFLAGWRKHAGKKA